MKVLISSIVCLYLALMGAGVTGWALTRFKLVETVATALGSAWVTLAASLAGALIGLLVWRLGERKNWRLPIFMVLGMACGWFAILVVAQEANVRLTHQILELEVQAQQIAAAKQARLVRAFERMSQQEKRAAQASLTFQAYEARLPPNEREALRQIEDDLIAESQRYQREIDAQLANIDLPAGEWLRSGDVERYARAREQYRELARHMNEFTTFLQGLGDTYQSRLDALNLPEPAKRYGIAQKERLLQDPAFQRLRDLRGLDARMAILGADLLDLLVKNPRQWHRDEATDRLAFDSPEFERQINWLLEEIMVTGQQQQALEGGR